MIEPTETEGKAGLDAFIAAMRAIASDSGGGPITVSVVPNYDFFSVSNFRYYAGRDGLPFRFVRAG